MDHSVYVKIKKNLCIRAVLYIFSTLNFHSILNLHLQWVLINWLPCDPLCKN